MSEVFTVRLDLEPGGPIVRMVDQRLLPTEVVIRSYSEAEPVARSITDMVVRGAPAIGITAAYGIAVGLWHERGDGASFDAAVIALCARFTATRPTAVNLFWAIKRMVRRARGCRDLSSAERGAVLVAEARAIHDEDRAACLAMGDFGAALLPDEGGVLTHCNAGALATGGQGTALGVIRSAVRAGKKLNVWVDETRPYLQGARLTAWEMHTDGIPCTLITDNMAAWQMKQGRIQAAVVGSDRIAANGDVSNKIGTYGVAVLCAYHGIPLYVAAPTSTIDLECATGAEIPIEERDRREVTHVGGWAPPEMIAALQVAPEGVPVVNPAFDVTPAALVAGIATEFGVIKAPYGPGLARVVGLANDGRSADA